VERGVLAQQPAQQEGAPVAVREQRPIDGRDPVHPVAANHSASGLSRTPRGSRADRAALPFHALTVQLLPFVRTSYFLGG
jgi:hypothetical protein